MTALDQAFAAMEATPGDDATRLRYYDRLADAELCLLLAEEAADTLTPELFDLDDGRFVLVFEDEERLAGFVGAVSPYAALPGRVIVGMLAGQGIGLGVNLEAASSLLIPAAAVDWLAQTLGQVPEPVQATPLSLHPPKGLPQAMLQPLDAKLAQAAGLAESAYLAAVSYSGGRRGHMLAFVGAAPGAEAALAKAVGEALTFSGIEAGELDVAFLGPDDPMVPSLIRVGLKFDLPARQPAEIPTLAPRAAPGSDPTRPPILHRVGSKNGVL